MIFVIFKYFYFDELKKVVLVNFVEKYLVFFDIDIIDKEKG